MATRQSKDREARIEVLVGLAFVVIDRAREWGDVKPNVVYEYGAWAIVFGCFLRALWICKWTERIRKIPKFGGLILIIGTLIAATWQPFRDKYRLQHEAIRPLVSPDRVQLSNGTNLFGTRVTIFNPGESEIHAITGLVEIDGGISISSVKVEPAMQQQEEKSPGGDPQVKFFASLEYFEPNYQCRFLIFQILHPKERQVLWVRGTTLSNSFARISIIQYMNTPPQITYSTNGQWQWPIVSAKNDFWKRTHALPIDMGLGVQMDYGSNRVKIPSRP